MTKRQTIRDSVVDLLSAPGKPVGLTVLRRQVRPFEAEQFPAVEVSSVSDLQDVEESDNELVTRELTLALTYLVEADREDPEAALEPLVAWGTSQLLQDPLLGGLTITIEEAGTEWFADEREHLFAAARVEYELTYTTLPTGV